MFKIIFCVEYVEAGGGQAMPYSPEHKQTTRQRILASAARLFNRKGFSEVTIGEIMTAAGLTHGVIGTSRARMSSIPRSSRSSCAGCPSLGRRSQRRGVRRGCPLRVMSSMPICLASTSRMSMARAR